MQGLLDFIKTPAGQGLLAGAAGYAANARRGAPINSIGRGLLGGLVGYGAASDRESEAAERAKMGQFRDAQIAAYTAEAAQKQAAAQREAAKRAALPGLMRGPGMTGGQAMPQTLGGLEMFSQPMGAAPMQATPGGFDVQGAVAAGFSPEEIAAYAGLSNIGRPKVARTVEVDDGNGGKATVQVDDYGQPVGQKLPGYVAPVQVDTGRGVQFVRPQAGVSLAKQPTFADGIARERLNFDKSDPKLTWNSDLGGFVNPRTREVMPAMRNGQPVSQQMGGVKLTEDQGKATGWLVQAQNAWKNMQSVAFDKDGNIQSAARPGFNDALAAIPSMGLTTGAANMMRSPERQKFMQGASSLSESLLRAATGAGVNRDEAEQKVRELTPVFGDDEETVKQKMAAIPLYIETLKVRAGPGAARAEAVGKGAGATMRWNPASGKVEMVGQ